MYHCRSCFYQYENSVHRCTSCGKWNTIFEGNPPKNGAWVKSSDVVKLKNISSPNFDKIPSGTSELDRVLGGGFTIGGIYLIAGPPGVGKSTLVLAVCGDIVTMNLEPGETPYKVLYAASEELKEQIKLRAKRICPDAEDLLLVNQANIETIESKVIEHDPDFLVVDSASTIFDPTIDAPVGSINQIKACAAKLNDITKQRSLVTILIGHITKDGDIAGPKALEHLVDGVLLFSDPRKTQIRTLEASKHRFGPTDEIGIFRMENGGLTSLQNPVEIQSAGEVGSSICISQKGNRALLIEFQTLAGPNDQKNSRIHVEGMSPKRVYQILAILFQHVQINLYNKDIFVNIPGGLEVDDHGTDLGLAMALASNFLDIALPEGTSFFGEIGLSGELRPVSNPSARIKQSIAMGIDTIMGPILPELDEEFKDNYIGVATLNEAVTLIFERQNIKPKAKAKKPKKKKHEDKNAS